MSWKRKEKIRSRLAGERGTIVKEWGGKRSVALLAPCPYAVGMGNLAVHTLYRLLNAQPDIVCERVFLPDPPELAEHRRTQTPPLSLETQRPLSDFDAIACTLSFENDLLHLLPLFELARLPHRAEERTAAHPLVIAGGAAPTLNPEPLAAIADAVFLGEAEEFIADLCVALVTGNRFAAIDALAQIPGVWLPSSGTAAGEVARRSVTELDRFPTETVVYAAAAEFGDRHLIEVQRGCPRGCRYCATPGLYAPFRFRSATSVLAMVERGARFRDAYGLIGAEILSYPDFAQVAEAILARGKSFSLSSARVDAIDEARIALLARAGVRSIALGVEAGTERLRRAIAKPIPDAHVVEAAQLLARGGITKLRLYFMIGLPGETPEDVAAIPVLARQVRDALRESAPRDARQTEVALTLSPFVPKRRTPFADEPFAGERALKAKLKAIRRALANDRDIAVRCDAIPAAAVEAFLAQAGPEAIDFLEAAHESGNARRALPRADR